MRLFLAMMMLLAGLLGAGEGATGSYPLWDGVESVESYARRVNLPAAKSIDLGGGVAMELVLIPAGKFVMGTAAMAEPRITPNSAFALFATGLVSMIVLLIVLKVRWFGNLELTVSLRWFLAMIIALGMLIGGVARWHLALKEMERYAAEKEAYDKLPQEEKPAREVTLTQPFYMGKHTVTQGQYQALMGSDPGMVAGAQFPVETVSWYDAQTFCGKLMERACDPSQEVRLPKEAEWEFACRAGTTTRFYSGDRDDDLDAAGWSASNSGRKTHPVGTKKPNAFGLYDMHGNVWQWCDELYIDQLGYFPLDRSNGERIHRSVRGGSCRHEPRECRSAIRFCHDPEDGRHGGFRVVMVVR